MIRDVITIVSGISIHAPRVGSDLGDSCETSVTVFISIHAPRVGSDVKHIQNILTQLIISIHAPRVGSDGNDEANKKRLRNFNPRSPCGERQNEIILQKLRKRISIHAPRVGSDF